jgi:hypothetical protein
MFKDRSKSEFISIILAVGYLILAMSLWAEGVSEASGSAEQIGAGIASLFILPHIALAFVGTLLATLGFFVRSAGLSLSGAIVNTVAAVTFIFWGFALIPAVVFGFVAYAAQKNKKTKKKSK